MSSSNRRAELGQRGERLAADFLQAAGYRVVERNLRTRWGEIDIVAEDGDCVVFVEVRTQSKGGWPEESVTRDKRRRVARLGMQYLQQCGRTDSDWRVDVIAIEMGTDGRPARLEHYIGVGEEP